jgi:hypothetical protein
MSMTMTMSPPNRRHGLAPEPPLPKAAGTDSSIPVAFKSPMSPRAIMASLDRRLTLRQAVRELRQTPPADAGDHRLLLQLQRELSGMHDFLALGPDGELTKVDPETTTLGDISVPREVRTPRGVETTPVAACEIQAYAPVGITQS